MGYWNDFHNLAKKCGFADPRLMKDNRLTINNRKLEAKLGTIKVYSATYRLWKLMGWRVTVRIMDKRWFTRARSLTALTFLSWMATMPLRKERCSQYAGTHGGCLLTPGSSSISSSLETLTLTMVSTTDAVLLYPLRAQRLRKEVVVVPA